MSAATANHHRGTNPFEELLLEADRHQVNDIFSSEFDQADCMNIPMTMQPFQQQATPALRPTTDVFFNLDDVDRHESSEHYFDLFTTRAVEKRNHCCPDDHHSEHILVNGYENDDANCEKHDLTANSAPHPEQQKGLLTDQQSLNNDDVFSSDANAARDM